MKKPCEELWEAFAKSGNINYYLLYSKIMGEDGQETKRDSNKE